jgi:Fe-S cluster assembly protein SufD
VVATDLGEQGERAGARLAAASAHPDFERLLDATVGSFAAEESRDLFDDLATAFGLDATVLTVPAGVELSAPVVVVNLLALGHSDVEAGPALFPRTVIDLGANAGAEVVELLVSGDGEILVVPTAELSLADGARLRYSTLQQLGRRSWQIGHVAARSERDATLRTFMASLGGGYARTRTDSRLDGQGARAELLAAFLGDGTQMHDFRTLQEHVAPRTSSDLVFKGAVGGTSRSVYSGLVRMRHGARGATAFQTNRNLVLSDGAHADSVPNLDIQENDVKCSHASAVGPIDPEQRFYLQSRGVPRQAAERLILLGFFEELLERATPAIRDHVVASIHARVGAITAGAAS